MKKLIYTFLLLSFTVSSFAGLKNTKIESTTDPSIKQVETAIKILTEAVMAKKAGKELEFKSKLSKAKKFQERQTVQKYYKAAFLSKVNNTTVNYLEEILDDNYDLRFDVMIEETCFIGNVKEANDLLKEALSTDVLNYDEQWYENSRVSTYNTILINRNDGPNNLSDTFSINKCK